MNYFVLLFDKNRYSETNSYKTIWNNRNQNWIITKQNLCAYIDKKECWHLDSSISRQTRIHRFQGDTNLIQWQAFRLCYQTVSNSLLFFTPPSPYPTSKTTLLCYLDVNFRLSRSYPLSGVSGLGTWFPSQFRFLQK